MTTTRLPSETFSATCGQFAHAIAQQELEGLKVTASTVADLPTALREARSRHG